MAYVNNGVKIARGTQIKVYENGVVIDTINYDLCDAFQQTPAITEDELSKLSDIDYITRLDAFKEYVKIHINILYPRLNFNFFANQHIITDNVSCPLPGSANKLLSECRYYATFSDIPTGTFQYAAVTDITGNITTTVLGTQVNIVESTMGTTPVKFGESEWNAIIMNLQDLEPVITMNDITGKGYMSINIWFYNNGITFPNSVVNIFDLGGTSSSESMVLYCNIDYWSNKPALTVKRTNNGEGMGIRATYLFDTENDAFPLNQWTMITLTYDGGKSAQSLNLYKDGVLLDTILKDGDENYNGITSEFAKNIYIGSSQIHKLGVTNVGIWTTELTASDVTKLYNNGNGIVYPFT